MNSPNFVKLRVILLGLVFFCLMLPAFSQTALPSKTDKERKSFGLQLFEPRGGFVLTVGQELPPLEWEHPDTVAAVTPDPSISTRWFNEDLQEVTVAVQPGRYIAYGEATGPDGSTYRRAFTTVAVEPDRNLDALADQRSANADSLVQSWRETEFGAIELAAMMESGPDAVEPRIGQWQMENATRHVRLKRKVLGRSHLPPVKVAPRQVDSETPTLRPGTPTTAGITEDRLSELQQKLDSWYDAVGEPTAVVIAKNGTVVFNRGYGTLDDRPVTKNTPMLLHSAMKPLIGTQFAMYVDRGLMEIDEPIGNHLEAFNSPQDKHLTFRAGHVHATGINFPWPLAFSHLFYFHTWHETMIASRPRDWAPGDRHKYGVVGIILSVQALELIAGRNYWDAMERELFEPLAIKDMLPGGTGFSAEDLARFGVMLANKGKYGDLEFFSEDTYSDIIPTELNAYFPNIQKKYGVGFQSYADRFGHDSYGHGGGCGTQLTVYPNDGIVFSMVRNNRGDDYKKHLAEVADIIGAWIED